MEKYMLFTELAVSIANSQKSIRDFTKGNLAEHPDLFVLYCSLDNLLGKVTEYMHEDTEAAIKKAKEIAGVA